MDSQQSLLHPTSLVKIPKLGSLKSSSIPPSLPDTLICSNYLRNPTFIPFLPPQHCLRLLYLLFEQMQSASQITSLCQPWRGSSHPPFTLLLGATSKHKGLIVQDTLGTLTVTSLLTVKAASTTYKASASKPLQLRGSHQTASYSLFQTISSWSWSPCFSTCLPHTSTLPNFQLLLD